MAANALVTPVIGWTGASDQLGNATVITAFPNGTFKTGAAGVHLMFSQ